MPLVICGCLHDCGHYCVDESVSACVRVFDFMEYGCVRRWKIENRLGEDNEDGVEGMRMIANGLIEFSHEYERMEFWNEFLF